MLLIMSRFKLPELLEGTRLFLHIYSLLVALAE